jgi:hypothetical protein
MALRPHLAASLPLAPWHWRFLLTPRPSVQPVRGFSDPPNKGEPDAIGRSSTPIKPVTAPRLVATGFPPAVSVTRVSAPPPQPGSRSRLLLAAGLAGGLALAVVLITVLRGTDEHEFTAPPQGCIESWNDDPAAVAFGQHQSGSHNYYEVEVLTLSNDGAREVTQEDPGASCAVIFAATALDPEPVSAAQIEKRGAWIPLSQLAEFDRLEDLQAGAQADYNAQLTPEGTLQELDS